jgi:hypothetical protein
LNIQLLKTTSTFFLGDFFAYPLPQLILDPYPKEKIWRIKERNERERERNVDEQGKLSYRPSQNRVRKRKIYLHYEVPSSIRDRWKAIDMIGLEES